MKISIITPTYNSQETINRNISSIINQSYSTFEQIIVDNKSTDDTLKIAKQIYADHGSSNKLIILSEKDEGISDAFNKGIKIASGEVIAILNSDDAYYTANVLERVTNVLEDTELLFVHGDIYFNDPIYGSNIRRPLLCSITKAMPYNHPTLFFKKSIYDNYGLYDTAFKFAMDYELIVRYEKKIDDFRQKGKYAAGEPLAVMYAGGASWKNEIESIREIKKALKLHHLWNISGVIFYTGRVFRARMKQYLTTLGGRFIVKLWRKFKWKR